MCSFRRATRRSSDSDSDSSSFGGVEHIGAGGTLKSLTTGVRVSQSVSAHRGRRGLWFREGGGRVIVIGM